MKTIDAIIVDQELCKACGICIDLCPREVYDRDALGHPVVARQKDCSGCLFCEWHCPDFAVQVVVAPAGKAVAAGARSGGEAS